MKQIRLIDFWYDTEDYIFTQLVRIGYFMLPIVVPPMLRAYDYFTDVGAE